MQKPVRKTIRIGFDNVEGGDNYGLGISDKDTVVCHKYGNVCDKCWFRNNIKGRCKMAKIKIIETVLSAVSALIMAAMYVIKFIKYVVKLNHQPA